MPTSSACILRLSRQVDASVRARYGRKTTYYRHFEFFALLYGTYFRHARRRHMERRYYRASFLLEGYLSCVIRRCRRQCCHADGCVAARIYVASRSTRTRFFQVNVPPKYTLSCRRGRREKEAASSKVS